MNKAFDVAVVGSASLAGEAIIELLAERDFPVGQLFPLESGAEGGRIKFRSRHIPVQDLDAFDFTQAPIVFFAADEALASETVSRAVEAGCVVIDASGTYARDRDVPLVIPELNPEVVGDFEARHILASPSGAAVVLALTLAPIRDAVGLERVNVFSCHPVSGRGKGGIEELASQTAKLLNAQPLDCAVFSRQIAFNILPQVGTPETDGATREEQAMGDTLRRVFAEPDLGINATAVQLPVFFGYAMALHVEAREGLSPEQLRERYGAIADFEVLDEGEGPTPVTEAAQSDTLFVGRIRKDGSRPHGLNLWVVADNIRRGIALNSVQIAEVLVREYL